MDTKQNSEKLDVRYRSSSIVEKHSIALFKKNLLKESYNWFQYTDYNKRLIDETKKYAAYKYETKNIVTGRIQFGWGGIYCLLCCVVVVCDNGSWQSCLHSVDSIFYSPEALTVIYFLLFLFYSVPILIFHQCLGLTSQSHCVQSCKMVSRSMGFLYALSFFSTVTFCSVKICGCALEIYQNLLRIYWKNKNMSYTVIKFFIDMNTHVAEDCDEFLGYRFIKAFKNCFFYNEEFHSNFYENVWFVGNRYNFWYLSTVAIILLVVIFLIIYKKYFRVFKMFIFVIMINWITSKTAVLINFFYMPVTRKTRLVEDIMKIFNEIGIVKMIMFIYGTIARSCSVFIFCTFASYFHTDLNVLKISTFLLFFYVVNMYLYLKNEEYELTLYKKVVMPPYEHYNFIKCNAYTNLFFKIVNDNPGTSNEFHQNPSDTVWQKLCLFFTVYTYICTCIFTVITQLLGPVDTINELRKYRVVDISRKVYSYKTLVKLYEKHITKQIDSKKAIHNDKTSSDKHRTPSPSPKKWALLKKKKKDGEKNREKYKNKDTNVNIIYGQHSRKDPSFTSREDFIRSDSYLQINSNSFMCRTYSRPSSYNTQYKSVSFKSHFEVSSNSENTESGSSYIHSYDDSTMKGLRNDRREFQDNKTAGYEGPIQYTRRIMRAQKKTTEGVLMRKSYVDFESEEPTEYGEGVDISEGVDVGVYVDNEKHKKGTRFKEMSKERYNSEHEQQKENIEQTPNKMENNTADELVIKENIKRRKLFVWHDENDKLSNQVKYAVSFINDENTDFKKSILKSTRSIDKKEEAWEEEKTNTLSDNAISSIKKHQKYNKKRLCNSISCLSTSNKYTGDNFDKDTKWHNSKQSLRTYSGRLYKSNITSTSSGKYTNSTYRVDSFASKSFHLLHNLNLKKYDILKKHGNVLLFLFVFILTVFHIADFKRNKNIKTELILYSIYKVLLLFIICVQTIHACWIFGFKIQISQCGLISTSFLLFTWIVIFPIIHILIIEKNIHLFCILIILVFNIISIIICYVEVMLKIRENKKIENKFSRSVVLNSGDYDVKLSKWQLLRKSVFWLYMGNIEVLRRNMNIAISGNEKKYIPFVWGFVLKYVNSTILIIVTYRSLREYVLDLSEHLEYTFSLKIELTLMFILILFSFVLLVNNFLLSKKEIRKEKRN